MQKVMLLLMALLLGVTAAQQRRLHRLLPVSVPLIWSLTGLWGWEQTGDTGGIVSIA